MCAESRVCTSSLCVIMRRQQRSIISRSSSKMRFLFGFIIGCMFFMVTRFSVVPCLWLLDRTILLGDGWQHDDTSLTPTSTTDQNLVLVGVMSAKQFLESRIIPSFDTWATTVPGKVRYLILFCVTNLTGTFHPSCRLKLVKWVLWLLW